MTINEIPDERLRVFISPAQSNEGIFAWSEVRRRIKDYLKEFPYLNPFIIEDVASPVKSEQFYQMQLLRDDLVVASMIDWCLRNHMKGQDPEKEKVISIKLSLIDFLCWSCYNISKKFKIVKI